MCKGRVLSSCKALCRHLQNHSASKASQWMLHWRRGCVKRSVIASQLEEEVQQAPNCFPPELALQLCDTPGQRLQLSSSDNVNEIWFSAQTPQTNWNKPSKLIEMNKMGSYARFHDVQSCQYLRVQSSIGPATLCGGCGRPPATT